MKEEDLPAYREALLTKRTELVEEVKALRAKAPGVRDASYVHKFYQEDLNSRAKKILAIDRKLGRV